MLFIQASYLCLVGIKSEPIVMPLIAECKIMTTELDSSKSLDYIDALHFLIRDDC